MFIMTSNAPTSLHLTGSHYQSRIIATNGNTLHEASNFKDDPLIATLALVPPSLTHKMEGLAGKWWRQDVQFTVENRHRPLD